MRSFVWFFVAFFAVWGLFRCTVDIGPREQSGNSNNVASGVGESSQGHAWRALSVIALVKDIHPDAEAYAEYQGLKACDQPARLLCTNGSTEESGQLFRLAQSGVVVPASLASVSDADNVCSTNLGDGWRVASGTIHNFIVGLAPAEASSELVQGEVYRVHVLPPEKNCWNHQ